ncbi:MAG: hypothetical protein Ct9H90mP18_03760 [Gammaproteobacteria bacterium]|nr:MAG: hypothetical protein Ct9H90mP18_03760 [Gammaproteobacteria bacterium]
MIVSAEYKKEMQTRTYGGHAHAQQAGYDFVDTIAMSIKGYEMVGRGYRIIKSSKL